MKGDNSMKRKMIAFLIAIACLCLLTACGASSDMLAFSQPEISKNTEVTSTPIYTTERSNKGTEITSTVKSIPVYTQTTAQTGSNNYTTNTTNTVPVVESVVLKQVNEIIVYQTENQGARTQYKAVRLTDQEKINRYLSIVNTTVWSDPNGSELATLGIYTVVIKSDKEDRVIIYQGIDSTLGYVRTAIIPKSITLPDTGLNIEIQKSLQNLKLDFEEYIMPKKVYLDSFELLFCREFE